MTQRSDLFRIAVRGVARNLRRSMLTGATIAVGVAAIVFFRGYLCSLQTMMVDMVVNALTGQLQVERAGFSAAKGVPPLELDLPEELHAELLEVPGVAAVAPRLRFAAVVIKDERSSVAGVLAIDPPREKQVCPRGPGGDATSSGESAEGAGFGLLGAPLESAEDDGVIVGAGLARGLGIALGDRVSLLARTQKGSTDAIDGVVRGIYRASDPELNKRLVLVALRPAQKLLHMPARVTSFVVSGAEPARSGEVATALQKRLSAAHATPLDVRTWEQMAPYYRDVISLEDDIMLVIMGVIFVLVLAGIVNTMMMSVFERQREIGTLMALGFRRRAILALFLTEALVLAALAALAGVAAGLLLIAVTHHTGIPFMVPAIGRIVARPAVDLPYLALSVGVALVTSLAAGLYPALKASRLEPVEALHAL